MIVGMFYTIDCSNARDTTIDGLHMTYRTIEQHLSSGGTQSIRDPLVNHAGTLTGESKAVGECSMLVLLRRKQCGANCIAQRQFAYTLNSEVFT